MRGELHRLSKGSREPLHARLCHRSARTTSSQAASVNGKQGSVQALLLRACQEEHSSSQLRGRAGRNSPVLKCLHNLNLICLPRLQLPKAGLLPNFGTQQSAENGLVY